VILDAEVSPSRDAARTPPRGITVPVAVLAIGGIATIAAAASARGVAFEYHTSNLRPEFPEYHAIRTKVSAAYPSDGRQNPAYVLVDDPAEVAPVVAAVESRRLTDTLTPTILAVESLQDRFPVTAAAQRAKLDRIATIRRRLQTPPLAFASTEELEWLRAATATREPIPIDEVPRHLAAPFLTKDGSVGNLVLVYPGPSLSDGRNSMAFADDVGTITTEDGETYHAASMAIVAADMIRLMQDESPRMVALAGGIIVLMMLVMFRSVGWATVALVPTVVGMLWMFGMMPWLGMKLNFFNLVILPVVLGVGNDAGVHLVHRARDAGPGALRRGLRSAGEHVFMAALTTMIGFGALLLTQHPGIDSIGGLAVLGIGTTVIAALLLVPSVLAIVRSRVG